jgi:hypothetical protein
MVNRCIDQVVYCLKSINLGSIELVYKPQGIAYNWFIFKGLSLEPIQDISLVRAMFKTCKLSGHIEVQIKQKFGGQTYCYEHGQIVDLIPCLTDD